MRVNVWSWRESLVFLCFGKNIWEAAVWRRWSLLFGFRKMSFSLGRSYTVHCKVVLLPYFLLGFLKRGIIYCFLNSVCIVLYSNLILSVLLNSMCVFLRVAPAEVMAVFAMGRLHWGKLSTLQSFLVVSVHVQGLSSQFHIVRYVVTILCLWPWRGQEVTGLTQLSLCVNGTKVFDCILGNHMVTLCAHDPPTLLPPFPPSLHFPSLFYFWLYQSFNTD